MATEAQRRAIAQHRMAHLMRIELKPYKEEGAAIDAAAEAAGESRQAYILGAVHARMEAEGRAYTGRRVGEGDFPHKGARRRPGDPETETEADPETDPDD